MRTRQGVEGEVIVDLLEARLVGPDRNDLHDSADGAGVVLNADQFSAVQEGTKSEDGSDKGNPGNYTKARHRRANYDGRDNVRNHQGTREDAQGNYVTKGCEGVLAHTL